MSEAGTEPPQAKRPKLTIQRPGQKLEEYPITKSPVTVGRVKSNDIVILGDTAISREHCRFDLDVETGGVLLRDSGSSNGTFLDGAAVGMDPVEIRSGAKIQIGSTSMTFAVDRPSVNALVKIFKQKFKHTPHPPQPGEAERTAFKNGLCACGRCGATFGVGSKGPGEKVGCMRCRAVWVIPVVKASL